MKEAILLIIASIFAIIYNIIVLMVNIASADGEFETATVILTVLNTLKDAMIVTVILYNIFLG